LADPHTHTIDVVVVVVVVVVVIEDPKVLMQQGTAISTNSAAMTKRTTLKIPFHDFSWLMALFVLQFDGRYDVEKCRVKRELTIVTAQR
jgi:hypothetical protein